MRVINVIYTKNGEVEELTSFGVFEEQLSNDVVKQAEEKFTEYVRSSEPDVSDEDLDMYCEDGIYSGANYSYSIVWSDI